MKIILVRHGQSVYNQINHEEGRIFSGQKDIPLTEKGRQQALALNSLAIWDEVKTVYASPLERAYETARLASQRENIQLDARLMERSMGIFEG